MFETKDFVDPSLLHALLHSALDVLAVSVGLNLGFRANQWV
jgi:hypothetical protein